MKLRIIAVGTRMPGWVDEGTREYTKRLPPECRLELIEVRPARPGRDVARALQDEGERMLAAIGPRDRVVSLAIGGRALSTANLVKRLRDWRGDGRDVSFLIGGAEGLAPACLDRADFAWSLSPLTFPHGLARVIVAEQLYRAWSVLAGHPYHRP
jgi:23S rRNA (pseudouridine1915-N3)-methyltransferase